MQEKVVLEKVAKLEKVNEQLSKENTELRAKAKRVEAYAQFLQDKYQTLWSCTELLPKAVAQQLAIINLNVGEWQETEQFYEIKLPEVYLKVPKRNARTP